MATSCGIGCVKLDPTVGDTIATPTLGIVTSVIVSVSAIVGATVAAATSGITEGVILELVA
jgi:hypothetical protein